MGIAAFPGIGVWVYTPLHLLGSWLTFPLFVQIIDPYVEIEVVGIPADNAKYRTKTVMDNGKGVLCNGNLICM